MIFKLQKVETGESDTVHEYVWLYLFGHDFYHKEYKTLFAYIRG